MRRKNGRFSKVPGMFNDIGKSLTGQSSDGIMQSLAARKYRLCGLVVGGFWNFILLGSSRHTPERLFRYHRSTPAPTHSLKELGCSVDDQLVIRNIAGIA